MSAVFSHVFTRENPGKIQDFFDLGKKAIGEGSYGTVMKAKNKTTGMDRAIKAITKAKVKDKTKFEAECKIQSSLDHPNIVKLFEVFSDSAKVYLVMEICDGGELFDRIIQATEDSNAGMAFDERKASTYMQQIIGAMSYLHAKHFAHRDIKPENFLMENTSADAQIKIIDFGLAKEFQPGVPMKTKAGTPYYVAPQVLMGSYDEKCDVWSCGVIAFILLSGVPPFYGDTDMEILKAVKKGKFEFSPDWDGVSKNGKQLITDMLIMDPKQRLPFSKLINHAWLESHADKGTGRLHDGLAKSLTRFRDTNKFKKLALTVIAQQVKDSDIRELKETFTSLDKNNDGTLTVEEIMGGIEATGCSIQKSILQELDTDGSGVIDYTEFIAATLEKNKHINNENLWAAFKNLDVDGDGFITSRELKKVTESDDPMIASMMKEVDTDGDGQVSFDEFKALFK